MMFSANSAFRTRQQKIDAYNALFRIAKVTTVFDYDAIDVYGDIANCTHASPRGRDSA